MPGRFKPVWITALHEAAWMLFTRYGCYDLEATARGLALKILMCRDAVQHWGFAAPGLNQNGRSVRVSPAPCADVNGHHHRDAATSEAPSSTKDAMWRHYWASLMPVEENTGSAHDKHVLTLPVMLKDSWPIKAASASEPALVRWCAASDIPVSYL